MVRFAWEVETGVYAHAERHQVFPAGRSGGFHVGVSVEGSCRQDICGIHLTLPCSYLQEDKVQLTAILIAHSGAEKDSNSKLHTELAVSLASHGHAVVRCQCSGSKDSQDHSAKTAIAAFMTSPYAVSIQRWFFIGFSTAGQTLCRIFSSVDPPITGLILLSCLPQDTGSAAKGAKHAGRMQAAQAQMELWLRKVHVPILFVQRERSGTASLRALPSLIEGMQTPDVRVLLVSKKVNASGAPSIFQPHNLRSMVKVMHSFICYASHEGTECDIPTAESIADVVAAMEDPQPDNCMDEVAEPQEPKPKKSQPKISNSQPRFSALLAPKGVAPASAVKTSKTAKAKGKAAEGSASQVLGISKKAAGRKRKEEVTAGSLKGTTTTMRVKPAFPREGGGSPGGSMDYQREDDEFDGGSEMASGYEEPQFSLQQGGWRQQWAEQGDQPVHQSQGRNAVAGQPWVSAEGHRYSGDFAAQGGYEYYQR